MWELKFCGWFFSVLSFVSKLVLMWEGGYLIGLLNLGPSPMIFSFAIGTLMTNTMWSLFIELPALEHRPELQSKMHLSQEKIDSISTIFHPGLGGSPSSALSYIGTEHKLPLRGGEVQPTISSLLCFDTHAIEPVDISYKPTGLLSKCVSWAIQVKLIYLHHEAAGGEFAYYPVLKKMNVAQKGDYGQVVELLRAVAADDHGKVAGYFPVTKPVSTPLAPNLVLFGTSRGASTLFAATCVLARDHPDDWEILRKRIKLLVVQGGFDNAKHVLQKRYGDWLARVVESLLTKFTSYDPKAETPEQLVAHFPRDLPVFFVTSEVDTAVDPKCTLALRNAVVHTRTKEENERTHTLVLKKSHHSCYPVQDPNDAMEYKKTLFELYDKYIV